MIAVIGAAGFIGSHLSKRLEDLGNTLMLTDNFSRGKKEYLDYLNIKNECFNLNMKDYESALIATKHADIVYHCACRIGGMQFLHGSPEKELKALQDNVLIDTNIFKACIENKVKKIIYTSSVSVYNTLRQYGSNAVFKESDLYKHSFNPEGGYGLSKWLAEQQLDYMTKMGVKVGIARIFKSYGPCDDYSPESGQVVLSLMRKLLTEEQLVVWGTGNVSRCLVYIDDLIDALIKLANYNKSLTVNIGGLVPHRIGNLANAIASISGKKIEVKFDESMPEGPKSRIPDLTKAKKELNWKPTTSLNNGLKKCWKWMEQEFDD